MFLRSCRTSHHLATGVNGRYIILKIPTLRQKAEFVLLVLHLHLPINIQMDGGLIH